MHSRLSGALAGLAMLGLAGTADAVPVDLQLSLVIDSSGSISNAEFNQQIGGYADAFRQAGVINSIVNSSNGIAVNTILFSSSANEVLTFRQLQTEAEVLAFADDLETITRQGGATNIIAGIDLAVSTLNANGFDSANVIIDVSGDGPQNTGGSVVAARDAALGAGVSRINGIAIGADSIFDFYQANVIGGPDAFVLKADSFDDFDAAIANKIQLEVGPGDPSPVPAPGAIGLIGLGILTIGFALRRRPS